MKDQKNNGLEIGTKLYCEFTRRYYEPEIKEVIVEKIGRKYFEIKNGCGKKYSIETLKYEDKQYSQANKQLYRSLEEIELKNEQAKLIGALSKYFNNYSHRQLTIEQLREINQITKATTQL